MQIHGKNLAEGDVVLAAHEDGYLKLLLVNESGAATGVVENAGGYGADVARVEGGANGAGKSA